MYIYEHRVTYGEIDGQKIAFNAHYLNWCDQATYELFRKNGYSPIELEDLGFDFVVRKATIDYLKSATFDEIMYFRPSVLSIGKTSYQIKYEIVNQQDELIAKVELVHVNVIDDEKSQLPDEVRSVLKKFLVD